MKKINLTTAVLLIYLTVMCVIGWPGNKPNPNYTEYFCVMGASILAIALLRYVQTKRTRIRDKIRKGEE